MSKRQIEILKLLNSEARFFSVNELSNNIHCSEKTIRNELNSMIQILKDFNITIDKKPGQGVRVLTSESDYNRFLSSESFYYKNDFSPAERQKDILSQLILNDRGLLIKELSIDYHVSHTTINKDIQNINDFLFNTGVEIFHEKGEGIVIVGPEDEKRRLLAMITNSRTNDYHLTNQDIYSQQFLENFQSSLNIDFKKVESIVKEAELQLGFHLSSEAMVNLIIHIAIAIRRMQQGNSVVLSNDLIEKLQTQREFSIAESTANKIELEFNVRFSDEEKYYILLHFLGAKRIKGKNEIIDFKLESEDRRVKDIVQSMIKNVQYDLGIFLENDVHLFNSLILHMKPTISRLEYGLTIQNPLYDDIQRDYGNICNALLRQTDSLLTDFNIKITPHEIAYLALHFAAALERNHKSIRTVVMCASGLGTAQLLVAKLERNFANIEIIDVVSNLEANKYSALEADLIISTIHVNSSLPVIVVNPMLTRKDLEYVRAQINQNETTPIYTFLNPDNVYLNKSFKTKEEALRFIYSILLEKKYVTEDFLEKLNEREALGSTVVAPYIGLPHAQGDSVIASSILVITLQNPIVWDNTNEIQIILSVNISNLDAKRFIGFFRRLADLEYDIHLWDELVKTKDKEKFSIQFNKMFSTS